MEVKQIAEVVMDAVFPPHCVACGVHDAWLCASCAEGIEFVSRDACAMCGSLAREHSCADGGVLHGLAALGFYHDSRLRAVIHALKYEHATCVLSDVATLLHRWKNVRAEPWPWAGETELAIQHVPTPLRRVRERGFDHAEKIAELVREEMVPWATPVDMLRRVGDGVAQATLEDDDLRRANAMGVFECVGDVVPSAVLLVDDVFTTGMTMQEAARVVRARGAARVYGIVLALGK